MQKKIRSFFEYLWATPILIVLKNISFKNKFIIVIATNILLILTISIIVVNSLNNLFQTSRELKEVYLKQTMAVFKVRTDVLSFFSIIDYSVIFGTTEKIEEMERQIGKTLSYLDEIKSYMTSAQADRLIIIFKIHNDILNLKNTGKQIITQAAKNEWDDVSANNETYKKLKTEIQQDLDNFLAKTTADLDNQITTMNKDILKTIIIDIFVVLILLAIFNAAFLFFTRNIELEEANKQIKQHEATIVKQEKLAILGDITASVAHEINTPLLTLTLIMDSMQQYVHKLITMFQSNEAILKKVNEDEDLRDYHDSFESTVEIFWDALNQIRTHIQNMKSFIKFQESTYSYFDVNQEIETTTNIINFKLPAKVHIEKELGKELPMIYGSAAEINQVFMNLINNGIEAIPRERGGVITIRTRQNEEHKVVIEFIDNGVGMTHKDVQKIFKEKFSNKKGGVGIGLTICKEIIDKHEGTIEVESEQGKGTIFRIILF